MIIGRRYGYVLCGVLFLMTGVAAADFEYSNFSSIDGLNLVGDATQVGNTVRLTPFPDWQAGALWFVTRQRVSKGFETTFQFQITGVVEGGTDGLAFVVQNESAAAMGSAGGAIGYGTNEFYGGTGITRSLAVEFDTWDNIADWPDNGDNHVGINTRGTEPNHASHDYSLGSVSITQDMSDGNLHDARIVYAPGTMQVFLDDMSTPTLTVALDLGSTLDLGEGGLAWVGFTSATGINGQNHFITSWAFTEIPEPATLSLLALGACLPLLRRKKR